jgi:hypothetical protein
VDPLGGAEAQRVEQGQGAEPGYGHRPGGPNCGEVAAEGVAHFPAVAVPEGGRVHAEQAGMETLDPVGGGHA